MLNAEKFEYLPGLAQNGSAVVESDARLDRDLKAVAVARFDDYVQVRAHVFAVMARLCGMHGRGCIVAAHRK